MYSLMRALYHNRPPGDDEAGNLEQVMYGITNAFPCGVECTDVDVAKYKLPYVDKETKEEVPGKYDIILNLPRDDEGKVAPSGFYKLDW